MLNFLKNLGGLHITQQAQPRHAPTNAQSLKILKDNIILRM